MLSATNRCNKSRFPGRGAAPGRCPGTRRCRRWPDSAPRPLQNKAARSRSFQASNPIEALTAHRTFTLCSFRQNDFSYPQLPTHRRGIVRCRDRKMKDERVRAARSRRKWHPELCRSRRSARARVLGTRGKAEAPASPDFCSQSQFF